jgi:hypothetical protein
VRAGSYLFFTHVQKAGGTTVEVILRRHFGVRHVQVNPRLGWRYGASDFRFDRRMNPLARSYASHWLRPFVDFGTYDDRIMWVTMLREPIARFLSHYQYAVERMGRRKSFVDWMRNPRQHDWQTRLLAGRADADAAFQILSERYRCVGLLERFDESLLLMRARIGLPQLRVNYTRPVNAAQSHRFKEQTREAFEAHRDECLEYNGQDVRLYERVAAELFPAQVATYGAERLGREALTEFRESPDSPADRVRNLSYIAFRRVLYLPAAGLRRRLAQLRGEPDVRE